MTVSSRILERPVEIETKFTVVGPLDPTSLGALDVYPYHLVAAGEQHHQDYVLDTPTRAITSARYALRLRYRQSDVLLTFKGPNTGTGTVKEREELEVPVPADIGYDYRTWPAPIAEHVEALAGDEPLAPLVEIEVFRRVWHVERNGTLVGELVLDDGEIRAGGRATPVHEIEFELKGEGTRADLDHVSERLLRRLPVHRELQGKLQRGLALLQDAPAPGGDVSLYAVGLSGLRTQLERLRHYEAEVRSNGNRESVHDMRVALRRLRTYLDTLAAAPPFAGDDLSRLRRRLRTVARALGALRDLEVQCALLDRFIKEHADSSDELHGLRQDLRRARTRAGKRMFVLLDGRPYRHTLDQLDDLTSREKAVLALTSRHLVRHYVGSAIWSRYEQVLAYDTVVRDGIPEGMHKLRIACKRLRYTLEIFDEELGPSIRVLLDPLVRAQDHLGSLQDSISGLRYIARLYHQRGLSHGEARYMAALAADRDHAILAFGTIWHELTGLTYRRQLALLLASL